MDYERTGSLIRRLRLEKGMTQKQLADLLYVTEQAVSKWERGQGLPDISSLAKLGDLMQVNIEKLLNGSLDEREDERMRLQNASMYVCPACGNPVFSITRVEVSCCGRTLTPLDAGTPAEKDRMEVQTVDGQWYISCAHPMTKDDYISFTAFVNDTKLEIYPHYPEWIYELRLPLGRKGKIFWYSKKAGLSVQDIRN